MLGREAFSWLCSLSSAAELNVVVSQERWKNDYDLNKALRRNLRVGNTTKIILWCERCEVLTRMYVMLQGQKKELAAVEAETRAVGLPEHMRLLPKSEDDAAAAREAFRFGPKGNNVFDRNRKVRSRSRVFD